VQDVRTASDMPGGICNRRSSLFNFASASHSVTLSPPPPAAVPSQMYALKVVKVDSRVENAKALLDSYSNEIELLKSLKENRFIINLENSEVPNYNFACMNQSVRPSMHNQRQ